MLISFTSGQACIVVKQYYNYFIYFRALSIRMLGMLLYEQSNIFCEFSERNVHYELPC